MPHPVKQILVDVSNIVHYDHKTGIQRVVCNILNALRLIVPAGFKVVPVYSILWQPGYRYAEEFGCIEPYLLENYQNEPIKPVACDIFLGLDLNHQVVLHQSAYYDWLRQIGVKVYFVVYDLLPLLNPEFFEADGVVSELHRKWLAVLAQQDGIICISRSVADETHAWLKQFGPSRRKPLKIGWFHLGKDIPAPPAGVKLSRSETNFLRKFSDRQVFLMVGTIEPRKGHAQTLAAFELLWQQGNDVCLVIVGKRGWRMEGLMDKIGQHPEHNHKLFWLEDAKDGLLERLYQISDCMVYASEGEGFGLPLIEAANHGLALIVRDLPVFREIANGHAQFFPNTSQPQDLASSIQKWLKQYGRNKHVPSVNMPALTWQQSATQLLELLVKDSWYLQWPESESQKIKPSVNTEKATGRNHFFQGRVFFDHLPKTAGQAINAWLADTLGNGTVTENLNGMHRELLLQYGGKFPVISGHTHFSGEGLDPRYQYLTVVRHPVDRALSWLYFVINNHTYAILPELHKAAERVIATNGRYIHPLLLSHISNIYTEHFSHINHIGYLNAEDKLEAACQAIHSYDLVGLFEDLPEFISDTATLLGLPAIEQLAAVNVTIARPKLDKTHPALRRRLIELNQLDIAFYDRVRAWKMTDTDHPNDEEFAPKAPSWQKFQIESLPQTMDIPVLSHPLYFPANSDLLKAQTGILNASGHRVSTGQAGFLMFGPYVALRAGCYNIVIYGSVENDSDANGANVSIVSQRGAQQLCHSTLAPNKQRGILFYQSITVPQDCTDLEVRLWVEPQNQIRLDALEILPG